MMLNKKTRRRSKASDDSRAVDVARYVQRVREAQPSLDQQLAAYREQRRSYEEMRTAEADQRELVEARNRRQLA